LLFGQALYSKSEIRIDVEADIHSIAFNSDGELVATGGANTIQLLDTSDWSITSRITGTFPNVTNLVFNNASNILISSSSDSIIRFWNIHNINEVAQIPLSSPVRSMGLSLQDNETEKLVVLCQNGIIYNYALHADRPSLINEISLYLDLGFPWELNNIGNVKEKASAELARKQLNAANNSLIPWLADKSNSICNLLKLELHKEKVRKNRGKLYKALSVGDIDLAKKLIVLDNQQNGNQSYFSFERNAPLYLAVEKGYEDVVDLLVENRERTHDNDVHDKTLLELAAENNQDSIIKLLLAIGQNILNALFGAMY